MLAIFDLDETLIAGDCSHLFAKFLVRRGLATDHELLEPIRGFMVDYAEGRLDLAACTECNLAPLKGWTRADVDALMKDFIDVDIRPRILETGLARVRWHRKRGDRILVISASGDHLVQPIARFLGVSEALGVEVVWDQDRLTGEIGARRPFQSGKIDALNDWLCDAPAGPVWFYSDSHNDLPLLQHADIPVAVNPDPRLAQHARDEGWLVLCDDRVPS